MKINEKLINSINKLPTLPTIFSAITEAIEDPYTTNTKLANIILPITNKLNFQNCSENSINME